jgi:hypothetical protein
VVRHHEACGGAAEGTGDLGLLTDRMESVEGETALGLSLFLRLGLVSEIHSSLVLIPADNVIIRSHMI